MRPRIAILLLLASRCILPAAGHAQAAPTPAPTLSVVGHPGSIPLIRLNGKSYVEVDPFTHLIGGTVLRQSSGMILTLPSPRLASAPPSPVTESQPQPQDHPPQRDTGFSANFLRAGIESLAEIREWRVAIVNAVETGNPVTEDWVGFYRRAADNRRAFAAAAATTDSDRKAVPLLQNEFNHMQQLSESFVAMRRNLTYVDPDSFRDNHNPLDQKVMDCARGLAAIAANGHFEDVPSCH